ncbi:MAG: hypothetical protein JW759_02045 [Candidatus Coatesbacteria bacterium]|nr:hypothetical protein [Candidatus Coatesbacteria bacterium]
MATYCEFCHRRIRNVKKMVIDAGYSFCSEDCHSRALVLFEEDARESIRRSNVERDLLGAEEAPEPGVASVAKGDVGRTTMIMAAMYERRGDFVKAMVCWKKLALLHRSNLSLRHRAMKRIKDLKVKGSIKCQPNLGK